MTNDARRYGGNEYAPQPSMRPAPSHYADPQQVAVAYEQMAPYPAQDQAAYASAPPPVPADPNTVYLSRSYMAHGEPVSKITLRKPVARDIAKCGNPIKMIFGPDGRLLDMEMKWDVVIKYLPLLSTPPLPPSTIDEFSFEDLDACGAVLAPFFVKFQT